MQRKIILVSYPITNPAARYRIWQYKKYLLDNKYHIVSIVFPRDYYFWTYFNTYLALIKACKNGDIVINNRVFYFKNLFLLYFAMIVLRFLSIHIFDFDDALHLRIQYNLLEKGFWNKFKKLYRLLFRGSTIRSGRFWPTVIILKNSKIAFCGNKYLKDFSSKYCKQSLLIPTTLNFDEDSRKDNLKTKSPIILGWLGTADNLRYLSTLKNVFKIIARKYSVKVYLKVISSKKFICRGINLVNKPWSLKDQKEDLKSFDIGLMPLLDEPWVLGKCGFKAILYHSAGLPVVASNLGNSRSIVIHSKTGFLATSEEEWVLYLSKLIENKELRKSMGREGFFHIFNHYSTDIVFKEIKEIIDNLL